MRRLSHRKKINKRKYVSGFSLPHSSPLILIVDKLIIVSMQKDIIILYKRRMRNKRKRCKLLQLTGEIIYGVIDD